MPYKNPADESKRSQRYRAAKREEAAAVQTEMLKRLRRTSGLRKEELRASTTMEAPLPAPAKILATKAPAHGLRIAVIPDAQVRDGVPTEHLRHAGKYLADKQPDVILVGGDWWDMPTLSNWNQPGSYEKEGARYWKDVDAGCRAMERFMTPIAAATGKWQPKLVFLEGNHEDRIDRAVRANPNQLMGVYSKGHLRLAQYGFTVIPFLQPVTVGGVAFNHYFPAGVMGKPIQSASMILKKMHMSCFAFHQQGRDIAYSRRADGATLTAIISGSFYQHNEPYMSPLANKHWRGMWMLHEVHNGQFDEMPVSISFLKRKFG